VHDHDSISMPTPARDSVLTRSPGGEELDVDNLDTGLQTPTNILSLDVMVDSSVKTDFNINIRARQCVQKLEKSQPIHISDGHRC
jgi:hypothetical protein